MVVYYLALKLFLVSNAIGIIPAILALIKDFPPQRQRVILLRESLFALLLAVFFQFVGHAFLAVLGIQGFALGLCGGVLLLLLGLGMVFPSREADPSNALKQEPFFVPIATPLLAGAGLMSIIMTFSAELNNHWMMLSSLLLAWMGVMGVMFLAPYLLKTLGMKGLQALEKLMGLILMMTSTQMILNGIKQYLNATG